MELLVTIGIVALLVTFAVPATQRVMHRARAVHCMSNLKQLGSALQLYLADYNNVMPELVAARESTTDDQAAIDNTLDSYLGSADVFCCKADNKGLCAKTGTSYHWNNLLNGQNVASMDFMGFITDGSKIPVMGDKENFHKYRDVKVNILYADGHVSKEIRFTVGDE